MLGGGTEAVRSRQPVRVKGLGSGVVSVSVAKYRACAVKVDGSLWCWGRDRSWTGQSQPGDDEDGDPTPPYLTTPPVRISGLPPVSSVSLAASAACAVTTAGATWCWGSNWSGGLGVGSDAAWVSTPVQVTGLGAGTTVDVDGPGYGWCALTTVGGLRCWGNYLSDSQSASPEPVDLPGLTSGVTSLDDSCAVLVDGTVRCWGLGYAPFMTDNSSLPSEPQPVPGLDVPVVEYADLCARTSDGAAICRDPITKRWAPVLGLGTGVAHITGGDAPCAVTRAGVAYCWGAVIGGKNPYDRIPKPYRWTDSPLRVPNPT
jgi:hypothetical protein